MKIKHLISKNIKLIKHTKHIIHLKHNKHINTSNKPNIKHKWKIGQEKLQYLRLSPTNYLLLSILTNHSVMFQCLRINTIVGFHCLDDKTCLPMTSLRMLFTVPTLSMMSSANTWKVIDWVQPSNCSGKARCDTIT